MCRLPQSGRPRAASKHVDSAVENRDECPREPEGLRQKTEKVRGEACHCGPRRYAADASDQLRCVIRHSLEPTFHSLVPATSLARNVVCHPIDRILERCSTTDWSSKRTGPCRGSSHQEERRGPSLLHRKCRKPPCETLPQHVLRRQLMAHLWRSSGRICDSLSSFQLRCDCYLSLGAGAACRIDFTRRGLDAPFGSFDSIRSFASQQLF